MKFPDRVTSLGYLKTPWAGAGVVLVLIWTLWTLDLHPHYSTIDIHRNPSPSPVTFPSCKSTNSTGIVPAVRVTPPDQRPLILYAYFETEKARKNLKFFIDHGLHGAADFIFVLNGNTDAEKLVPNKPNIKVIKRKNECYDMGAFASILKKDDLYKKYNRFITMNASIRGPFLPDYSKQCWSDVYLDKITDKVKLVGMTLGCRPMAHVQSMIWALDRIGMETLLVPSEALVKKFRDEIPPKGDTTVPMIKKPGIDSCPNDYWDAVSLEVYATPLMRIAGYDVDTVMTAYHSIPDYEKACWDFMFGDVLYKGTYYGMDLHPFDALFVKTNRNVNPIVADKLAEWADLRHYSSYDYCH